MQAPGASSAGSRCICPARARSAGRSCILLTNSSNMPRAREECRRFIALLHKKFGPEPEGVRLAVKAFLHDFGDYLEIICYFDETLPESVEYALHCEDNLPATWDDESHTPL